MPSRLLSLILILLTFALGAAPKPGGVSPEAVKLPEGPGSMTGLGESFDANLVSGTAKYSIPIDLPKGALTPAVSISYNGGFGNGIAGLGWSFELPEIARQTDKGLPVFNDAEDRFIYRGPDANEELVQQRESSYYRLKNESAFSRISHIEDGSWKVEMRDGTTTLYGKDSSSRDSGKNGRPFSWKIAEVADRFGHKVTYNYMKSDGYLYPKEIIYQEFEEDTLKQFRNKIMFIYEDRDDRVLTYIRGSKVLITKRVKEIRIVHGSGTLWSYSFEYRDAEGFSLLTKVKKTGRDGKSSLPALTFEYTNFETKYYSVENMEKTPSHSFFGDGSATFADMNADGLPDVLVSRGGEGYYYYKNRDGKSFEKSEPELIGMAPARVLSDPGVFTMDMDGDSFLDVVYKDSNGYGFHAGGDIEKGRFRAFEKRKEIAGNIPYNFNDENIRVIDVTHDGRPELLIDSGSSGLKVIYNLKHTDSNGNETFSWSSETEKPALPSGMRFSDKKVQFKDMNGDGLQDLIRLDIRPHYDASESRMHIYYGLGWGEFSSRHEMGNLPSAHPEKIYLRDANGDGLPDLVQIMSSEVRLYLNNGSGRFANPRIFSGKTPEFYDIRNIQFADMNGNGSRDIVFMTAPNESAEIWQFLDFRGDSPHPNLLKKIDNGMGKVTEIEYKSSVDFMIEDRKKGFEWTSTLPNPVSVVSRVKVNDSLGWESESEFIYSDGYYDGKEKEFRGFRTVKKVLPGDESQGMLITETTFNLGESEEALKGKALKTKLFTEIEKGDDREERIFTVKRTDWETRELLEGRNDKKITFAYSPMEMTEIWEKTTNTGNVKYIKTEREYDDFGNMTKEEKFGETDRYGNDLGNDYIAVKTEYINIYNDPAKLMLGFPWKKIVSDKKGARSITKYLYDGPDYTGLSEENIENGKMTVEKICLIETDDIAKIDIIPDETGESCRWIDAKRMKWDRWGNMTGIMDAEGRLREIEYDKKVHAFPRIETIYTDGEPLTTEAEYDFGFGAIKSVTDFNGNRSEVEYDEFGRVKYIYKPDENKKGETEKSPSIIYSYHYGKRVSYIGTSLRRVQGEDKFIKSFSYFDGLGRKRQSKQQADLYDDGRERWSGSGWTLFNRRGSAFKSFHPLFSPTGDYDRFVSDEEPHITTLFDETGRALTVIQPDGTPQNIMDNPFKTVEYLPFKTIFTDEEGKEKTEIKDARGRVLQTLRMNESEEIKHKFTYNAFGSISTYTDPENNVKKMFYDTLNRRARMIDQSIGEKNYFYYDNGSPKEVIDNKKQKSRYIFDSAGRLSIVRNFNTDGSLDQEVKYSYDKIEQNSLKNLQKDFPGIKLKNLKGKLAMTEDSGGKTFLYYDHMGNSVSTIRELDGINYKMDLSYDNLGKVTKKTFPDGFTLSYGYDSRSLITSISAGSENFISEISYSELGQQIDSALGNGIKTSNVYDERKFITNIRAYDSAREEDIYYLKYSHDKVGNITKIESAFDDDLNQEFKFDDLYRLVNAKGGYGEISWSYSKSGNILKREAANFPSHISGINAGSYHYGDQDDSCSEFVKDGLAGPYAVTSVEGKNLCYDKNGNVAKYDGMKFSYDSIDQLTEVVKNGGIRQLHQYDSGGNRLKKTVVKKDENDNLSINETLYIFPDYEIRDGKIIKHITFGSKKIAQISGYTKESVMNAFLSGVTLSDEMVEKIDIDGNGEFNINDMDIIIKEGVNNHSDNTFLTEVRYFIHDHLGSTTYLTDETGEIISKQAETPFGMNWKDEGEKALYSFTGKERDREINLTYFGARFYIQDIGRWLSPDPLFAEQPRKCVGSPGECNLYVYVSNNPVILVDPLGLSGGYSELGQAIRETQDQPSSHQKEDNLLNFFKGGVDVIKGGIDSTVLLFTDGEEWSKQQADYLMQYYDGQETLLEFSKDVAIGTWDNIKMAFKEDPWRASGSVVTSLGLILLFRKASKTKKTGPLTSRQTRIWYLAQEAKIIDMIDRSLPLKQQAKQAFNLRNFFRSKARDLMVSQVRADELRKLYPNFTWKQVIQKYKSKGFTGDKLWKEIINASTRSRKSVNQKMQVKPKH